MEMMTCGEQCLSAIGAAKTNNKLKDDYLQLCFFSVVNETREMFIEMRIVQQYQQSISDEPTWLSRVSFISQPAERY